MTATMPEEDVEVAVEKAEKCASTIHVFLEFGHTARECPNLATVEVLGKCGGCGREGRSRFCDRCMMRISERQARKGWGTICGTCRGFTVRIVAVLPL